MRRYVRRYGSVTVGEGTGVDVNLVIRTDEVAPAEVLAKGFEEIPADLSDDQVKQKYGVLCICQISNDKMTSVEN